MTNKVTIFLSLALFALLFTKCRAVNEPVLQSDSQFQELYPDMEFDQTFDLRIEAPEVEFNEIGDLVKLVVTNRSSMYLIVKLPKNLRIYAFRDGGWQEIHNNVNYVTIDGGLVIRPEGDSGFGDSASITTFPELEGLETGTIVRFVLTAQKSYSSQAIDTGEGWVASFVDLIIE